VDLRTKTPVFAIWGIVVFSALLGLLDFASPVALGAVFSIAVIGQYVAFTLPIALKLFVASGKFRAGRFSIIERFNILLIRLNQGHGT
jgi:amino acid transporter